MNKNGRYTLYQLVFYPLNVLPKPNTRLFLTDGEEVAFGFYDESLNPPWRRDTAEGYSAGDAWEEVLAWAEPPDPAECMADCYREDGK